MTTVASKAVKAPESGFSYAAAASGKQTQMSASSTQASTPAASDAAAKSTSPSVNSTSPKEQETVSAPKAAAPAEETKVESKSDEKPSKANGKPKQPTVETVEDDQPNGWDNKSQVSGSEKAAEAPKKEFVLAPEPAVNFWKVRQETAQKAKTVSPPPQATTTAPPPQASKSAAPASTAASVKSDKTEQPKKKVTRQPSNNWEGEKPAAGEKKEGKPRKGAEGKEKPNGTFAAGEGSKPKAAKKDVTVPPLHDTSSWPTPENSREEKERKDREEKEQKAKAVAAAKSDSGKSKKEWKALDVPLTNTTYTSGTAKSDRPARGGRSAARGGASSRGGRGPKWEGQEGSAENDRGRANQEKAARGGYSSRGGKRASSAGNSVHRPSNESQFAGEQPKEGAAANGGWDSKPVPTAAPFVPHHATQIPTKDASVKGDESAAGQNQQYPTNQSVTSPTFPLSPTSRPDAPPFDQNNQFFYQQRERNMPPRGGFRGGRGGHFGGHHQSGPATPNTAGFQGVPYPPRGGQFKGPRSQSLPGASYNMRPYGQMPNYPYQPVYDYSGMPVGGVQHSPSYMDPTFILNSCIYQLDYYFSVDNLCKDMYLRKHMNSEGFVSFDLIAGFSRVKSLTQDPNILREAVIICPNVELARGPKGDGIRKKKDWQQWILPEEQRDPWAVEDNGPWRIVTWQEQHQASAQFQQQLPNQQFPPQYGNTPLTIVANGVNGTHAGQPLSADVAPFTPSTATQANGVEDEDVFDDDNIDKLIIVCRRALPEGAAAEKESIDGKTISDELLRYETKSRSGEAPTVSSTEQTRYYPSSPRLASAKLQDAITAIGDVPRPEVGWYTRGPVVDDPSALPYAHFLVHKEYTPFKAATLEKRSTGSAVNDMTVLYRFWRHFLTGHFNRSIYNEFRSLALEDLSGNNNFGYIYLLRFYVDNHLYNKPSRAMSRDFVDLARTKRAHALDYLKMVLNDERSTGAVRSQLDGFLDAELKQLLGA